MYMYVRTTDSATYCTCLGRYVNKMKYKDKGPKLSRERDSENTSNTSTSTSATSPSSHLYFIAEYIGSSFSVFSLHLTMGI